jgi:uncharacterized protein (DUF697 family)
MDASTPAANSSAPGGDPAAPLWPEGGQPVTQPVGQPVTQPGEPLWPSAPPVGPPVGSTPPPAAEWSQYGDDEPDLDGTQLPPQSLWQKMKADPQYAPEHLALDAVQRLGPQAQAWVDGTRARYPGIPADTVAQIAVRRFTTFARLSGAAAGATGLPGAVLDIGVLAWTQARMVLHIAAAYGVDPTDPERATDLLVLQKVHKVAQTARTALAVARGHEQAGALFGKGASAPMTQVFVQLGLKLAQMAGVKAAKKLFAKMVPGAAIILGTWANSSATKELAQRTLVLYQKAQTYPYQLPPAPPPS